MDLATLGTAEGPDWRPIVRRFTKDDLATLLTEARLDEIGQWRTDFSTYGGPWIATAASRGGYMIACVQHDHAGMRIANARLLAAAPELARQCLALIEEVERLTCPA